ncbi:MAG: GNAT family N-acetyltransferase [Planctomycetales bacterium]|nr:GNAT family N-acetyltransferase [Planctomycetales bacterium]
MFDIAAKNGFQPGATWLAARLTSTAHAGAQHAGAERSSQIRIGDDRRLANWSGRPATQAATQAATQSNCESCAYEYCGTIQGIADEQRCGGIQNLGVIPEHRGLGLGRLLLLKALEGFWLAGLQRASLEVTAQNVAAINLYRNLGFRRVKTVYKAVEVAYS